MMECPRDRDERILAYTAGTLEPGAQIEFERHLAECEACRSLAADQRAVWESLDCWKPAPVSPDFNARLYRAIGEEAKLPWWQRLARTDWRWVFRPAMPVAAACAALAIGFLIKQPIATHYAPASDQKVSIEQVERALDDMDMMKQMSLTAPPAGQDTGEQL